LRAVGRWDSKDFASYHRVLNRARWSALLMSRILLSLIICTFAPDGAPLILLVDDTLERRRGKQIVYKSVFRDAVRSTANRVTLSFGIRWLVMCVLVYTPWSSRPWALPFLAVPVLSEKRCEKLCRAHRSPTKWASALIRKIGRWYPEREIVLIGDGGYACVDLARSCEDQEITLVSRLRLDASLYDEPAPQPTSKRGPKPKKGSRQESLSERLLSKETRWQSCSVAWYASERRQVEYCSGVSLWHTPGCAPVPLRWVLIRCPEDSFKPGALFCTHVNEAPEQIIEWFVLRWNIEVTFEEVRACLGFETQRQWSRKAVGRTTPVLLGIFSLVVIMAKRLHPRRLPVQQTSWYQKEEPTFRDAIAAVRLHLWGVRNYTRSVQQPGLWPRPSAWRQTTGHVK
jgi:hypothetical protein